MTAVPDSQLYLIEEHFSYDECEKLTPTGMHVLHSNERGYWTTRTEIVNPDVDQRWWVKRMGDAITQANEAKFKFDLDGDIQIQRLEYQKGQFFDWHKDLNENVAAPRKLTAIAYTSSRGSYTGGRTEWSCTPGVWQRQGTVIVFPTWLPHRVHLVTEGTRGVIVAWARGPAFR